MELKDVFIKHLYMVKQGGQAREHLIWFSFSK